MVKVKFYGEVHLYILWCVLGETLLKNVRFYTYY